MSNPVYIQGINPVLNVTQADVDAWLKQEGITANVEFSNRKIGVVELVANVAFTTENDLRKFYLDFLEPRRKAIFPN